MTTETVRPLLLELGCEELPPAAQPTLALALRDAVGSLLVREKLLLDPGEPPDVWLTSDGCVLEKKDILDPTSCPRVWWSPRRLAVFFPAVLRHAPSRSRTVSGPLLARAYDAEGRPTPALLGFARAQGLDPDRLRRDGDRVVAERLEEGADLALVLERDLFSLLAALPAPRRMVWDDRLPPFPRPIRHLVLLHGDEILPVALGPLRATGQTFGHRVHHPGPVDIPEATKYLEALETASVVPVSLDALEESHERLERLLVAAATALAPEFPKRATPWRVEPDPELLDENLGLLEHPAAIAGSFDPSYLELPEEVIRVVLRVKQRAFILRDARGELLPAFVAPVDLESRDPHRLREGLERVVRPRLADALFFFRQDRGRRLEDHRSELVDVTLEHGLGSLADRTQRLVDLLTRLAPMFGVDDSTALRAAQLSQCDLLTAIVGEYPELEGTAGGFYARMDGEDEAVATALLEQVLPRHAGDRLPESPLGALLALALRLEILCGTFARGIRPSGQSDPMGLRRAAGGLLQVLLSGILVADPDLNALFREGLRVHGVEDGKREKLVGLLFTFHLERLSSILGVRGDLFQAVLGAGTYYWEAREESRLAAQRGGVDHSQPDADNRSPLLVPFFVADFRDRLLALKAVIERAGTDALRLVGANKRIRNILNRAEVGLPLIHPASPTVPPGEPPPSLALEALTACLEAEIPAHIKRREYSAVLDRLLATGDALERFFSEVLVMDPDDHRRRYRLALLLRLELVMHSVAALERVHVPGTPP